MRAKPTEYNGRIYASKLEARMARILHRNNIPFKYSQRVFTQRGNGHYREVDFCLGGEYYITWCDFPVNAIEVKGSLTKEAYFQKKDLRDAGITTFIATPSLVEFWEDYELLKEKFDKKFDNFNLCFNRMPIPEKQFIDTNHGVIEVPPARRDFFAGSASALSFESRNPSALWETYLPTNEQQHSDTFRFDTAGCVSFSANNSVESQLNLMYDDLPQQHKDFLEPYKKDGVINLSDRFLAKMSDTLPTGNYATKVADTLRHYGAVPETMWGWDTSKTWDRDVFWTEFYKDIPSNVKEQGLRFNDYFEVSYEWVHTRYQSQDQQKDKINKHLQHAPLQILIGLCKGYHKDNPINWCDTDRVHHAILLHGIDGNGNWLVFDHYNPFRKVLEPEYVIPWVLKVLVTPKNKMLTLFRHSQNTGEVYATNGHVKNHIANYYTLKQGAVDKLWSWEEGQVIHTHDEYTDLPEGAEIVLTPSDNQQT